MKYVEIIANAGSSDTISAIAEKAKTTDFRLGVVEKDGTQQMRKSAQTLSVGILLAVALSAVFGLLWPSSPTSYELMSRTDATLDSILLALASGAAATRTMHRYVLGWT